MGTVPTKSNTNAYCSYCENKSLVSFMCPCKSPLPGMVTRIHQEFSNTFCINDSCASVQSAYGIWNLASMPLHSAVLMRLNHKNKIKYGKSQCSVIMSNIWTASVFILSIKVRGCVIFRTGNCGGVDLTQLREKKYIMKNCLKVFLKF